MIFLISVLSPCQTRKLTTPKQFNYVYSLPQQGGLEFASFISGTRSQEENLLLCKGIVYFLYHTVELNSLLNRGYTSNFLVAMVIRFFLNLSHCQAYMQSKNMVTQAKIFPLGHRVIELTMVHKKNNKLLL